MMFSIPKMARAAVLEELGMPLVVRDISIPKLISGQVLVKVFFSGVCRSQLMEVSGGRGCDPWLPHLLGHEGSGEVLAVGKDVTKVKPGDQVILGWLKSEGMDAPGAKYEHCGKIINSGPVTTFSNYTVVSENRLVKKPKRLSFEEAILFGCALPTGMGMVLNELHPKQGQSVVVLGLGGIGLAALVTLKALGISNVIAVDRLGRNTIDVLMTLEHFKANNFKLKIENIGMDSDSPFFNMLVSILGTLAEQEKITIAERCKQGIEIAKSKGLYTGRKTGTIDNREKLLKKHSDIVLCLNKNMKVLDVSRLTKKTRVTVYKVKAML